MKLSCTWRIYRILPWNVKYTYDSSKFPSISSFLNYKMNTFKLFRQSSDHIIHAVFVFLKILLFRNRSDVLNPLFPKLWARSDMLNKELEMTCYLENETWRYLIAIMVTSMKPFNGWRYAISIDRIFVTVQDSLSQFFIGLLTIGLLVKIKDLFLRDWGESETRLRKLI